MHFLNKKGTQQQHIEKMHLRPQVMKKLKYSKEIDDQKRKLEKVKNFFILYSIHGALRAFCCCILSLTSFIAPYSDLFICYFHA